jgi:hypothetical protein
MLNIERLFSKDRARHVMILIFIYFLNFFVVKKKNRSND